MTKPLVAKHGISSCECIEPDERPLYELENEVVVCGKCGKVPWELGAVPRTQFDKIELDVVHDRKRLYRPKIYRCVVYND